MKTVKTIAALVIAIALTVVLSSLPLSAQQNNRLSEWLTGSLRDIPGKREAPVRYRMTADYFARTLDGNFINKNRVTGTVTYLFPSDTVRWNDCSISTASGEKDPFPPAEKFAYMENFTFIPGFQMSEADGFPGWPENSFHTKNLVWDMMAFDAFGWVYLDSLQLGKPFSPAMLNGEIGLAGQGAFTNKNSTIRWMGVTQYEGVECALIEYRQMNGSLAVNTPSMTIRGRSHYWGLIWITLLNRTIEYAEMTEGVNIWIDIPGVMSGTWSDNLREIKVEKLPAE